MAPVVGEVSVIDVDVEESGESLALAGVAHHDE
jgi:hypothetical protein